MESVQHIPEENIEHIDHLEANEATVAKYGERANNGVIVISLRYDKEAEFSGRASLADYVENLGLSPIITFILGAEDVTEGLSYTLLSDNTYSVYCPSDSIPENGELVLPDTYKGEPVTVFRSEQNSFAIPVLDSKSTSNYNGPAYTGISSLSAVTLLRKLS